MTSWIKVYVTADSPLRLKDLVRFFGPYRKLPPGEYTLLTFDTFRPSCQVVVSANAIVKANPLALVPAEIGFQKPWGAVPDEAPSPRR